METIQLLIVDHGLLFRDVLRKLLQRCIDFHVVDDVGSQSAARLVVRKRRIDVAMLGFDAPGRQVLDLIHVLKSAQPHLKVLVLAGTREPMDVARALGAGADGCLTEDSIPGELAGAIRHVARGGRYICPDIAHEFAMRGIRSDTGRLPPRPSRRARGRRCSPGPGWVRVRTKSARLPSCCDAR